MDNTLAIGGDALVGTVTSLVTELFKYLPFLPQDAWFVRTVVLSICVAVQIANAVATGTFGLSTIVHTVVSYAIAVLTYDHALKQ